MITCLRALHRQYTNYMCWQARVTLILLLAGMFILWV